jgi:hypothetical protein
MAFFDLTSRRTERRLDALLEGRVGIFVNRRYIEHAAWSSSTHRQIRTNLSTVTHSSLDALMDRKIDRTAVKKVSLHEAESDAAFWRSRPPEERLETVETIRREYHGWPEDPKNEDLPRLQRVYRVCKRT